MADDIDRIIHEPARLNILVCLCNVDSADFIFLMHQTGMSWGNLSSHLSKLEASGYVEIKKDFVGKKPHTMVMLTGRGKDAIRDYCRKMKGVIDRLPD